jgi:hypothetical protein
LTNIRLDVIIIRYRDYNIIANFSIFVGEERITC